MASLAPSRRTLLAGLALSAAAPAVGAAAPALGAEGLDPNSTRDQSATLAEALAKAAAEGRALTLPAGRFFVENLDMPAGARLVACGRTELLSGGGRPILRAVGVEDVLIDGVAFVGVGASPAGVGLVEIGAGAAVTLRDCRFAGGQVGVAATGSAATIENCRFVDLGDAAIHGLDSLGLVVRGNRIAGCGNAGVRIWRTAAGSDGSLVAGNRIEKIGWVDGGDGQNGNGVNIFRADDVIVSDNHFIDCAFTAVRVNAGRNTQIRGNNCRNSGEVAIFSEFEFSGTVIADNIIDGAALGISMTNLDAGGYFAVCTGNIVRNIYPRSVVNPDTVPVGIAAEADAVIANNLIENVPGVGIALGYGPFLRNVSATGNMVRGVVIGIGVSVVDDPARGAARVAGNFIAATGPAIAGFAWGNMVSDDLVRDAARFARLAIGENVVERGAMAAGINSPAG